MENENLRNIENLLAAKASTQPLYEFPVDQLPLGLRDSLSGVAAEARVPALFSALPIAATYADRLKAKYCDGSDTPMALMSIIIGEQASGKGVCRRIENIWAKKMDKDDEKPREDEAWFQQHKGKKGVVDPKPCIRHIGDTISKSALMRRQLCADGHTMYMFSEELGSMKSVWKVFGDYFRKAFDQSEVGQANILKAVTLLERSHGVMELPRMCEEFCLWLEAKRQLALANADRVMDVYRRRSAVIGFRCGVIFHILEQTGEETDACIRFAKAVADYVLAMQMEMFGLRLDKQQQDNEAIPVYKSRNTLLFAQLPEQFTLFDASRERGDGASRETIRKMISRWTKRGLCKKLKGGDTEIWQKLTLSA